MGIDSLSSPNNTSEAPDARTLARFLDELMPHEHERRDEERVPFCCRAVLYLDNSEIPVVGLIRDVSETGVGLLHDVPIEPTEATIRISTESGKTLCARVRILWCRAVARHYYLSGGEFTRLFADDPIVLDD